MNKPMSKYEAAALKALTNSDFGHESTNPNSRPQIAAEPPKSFNDVPPFGTNEPPHDGTKEPKAHPLAQFVPFDSEPKPPVWVIRGFLPDGLTVISGSAGVGKTTALLPLAMVAAGLHGDSDMSPRHWRHVVYATEDVGQAQRILSGIVTHGGLGINIGDVRDRLHLVRSVRLDAAYVAQVGAVYRKQFTRTIDGVEILPLIVFDTKSSVFAIENENDNSEASRMVAALKQDFAGLPCWLVAHVAKTNIGRSDIAGITSRGAGATECDGNGTAYLVDESGTRFLVLGKKRFEPRWPELEITSHTTTVQSKDEYGFPEPLTLRWSTAAPPTQSRKEAAQDAQEAARDAEAMVLRDEVRDAVETAWRLGNPLSRRGVRSKVNRNHGDVADCIESLLNERWLIEIDVPVKIRSVNSKSAFLVSLSTPEHEAVLRGEPLPTNKLETPKSWRKAAIPLVPDADADLPSGG